MSSWGSETVIKVPNKKVEGWALPEMPGEEFSRHLWQPSVYLGRHATHQRRRQRDELRDETNNRKAATKCETGAKEATVCAD